MLYYITILNLLISTSVSSEEDPIYVGKCPSEGRDSPDESINCPRYCMFWKGQLIDEIVCPPKFHYSPENETCISSGENECSETGDNSKKVNYGSCIGQCPTSDDAEDIFYLPHDDCTKYCICVFGHPLEMTCDDDKNFSTLDNKCIHPIEADMKCPEIRQELVPEETVEEITDYQDCLGQCFHRNATRSSNNTEHAEIVAHKTETKFCICRNGYFQVYDCPEHEVFVEENKACQNPKDPQELRAYGNRTKIQTNEDKPQIFKNSDDHDGKQCSQEDKISTHSKTTETNTTETKVLTDEEKESLGNEETIIETVITKKIKRTDDKVITTVFNTTTTTVVTVVTSVTPLVKGDQNGGSGKDPSVQCRHLIEQLLQKKVL